MIKVADSVRKIKADRLISITSIMDGEEDTLYYHFSWDSKPGIEAFMVKVPKGDDVESISSVFENATLLEAEVTELFGVKFQGNSHSGKRLFQAEGNEAPAMRMAKGVEKDA